MEEISITAVSSRRIKRGQKGVSIRKKNTGAQNIQSLYNKLFSALFYLIIGGACAAAVNTSSLWYETLLFPPYIMSKLPFTLVNCAVLLMLSTVFYRSLEKKDKSQIINLIINGVFCAIIFYIFYGLKSELGSLVILIMLFSQTITVLYGYHRNCWICEAALIIFMAWQVYIMSVIYAILMLN